MATQNEIIEALQFSHIQSAVPMNTTGAGRLVLTYEFVGYVQPYDAIWTYQGWVPFTTAQKQAVRDALDQIETFLNVDFREAPGADPDFNFGRAIQDPGVAGEAGAMVWGNRWDGQAVFNRDFDLLSDYGMHVILHEIGHMLGLDHSFDGAATLPEAYENNHYTIMSYTPDPYSGTYNGEMAIFDILALQDIWGAAAYKTGDTTYTGRGSFDVRPVWDTAGTDTFDATDQANGTVLDLRPGAYSTFGTYEDVAIAYGVTIENANGSAYADTITGNAARNILKGSYGDDVIYGRAGKDKLYGNGGDDTLYGGTRRDKLSGGYGDDTLYGQGGNDKLLGNRGYDNLWGNSGADTFIFRPGFETDVVRDFTDDVDIVKIRDLGTLAEVLAVAEELNGNVNFNFGGGDVLIVNNITLDALEDDLLVV